MTLLLALLLTVCPPTGDAKTDRLKALDVLKNRTERPDSYRPTTIAELLEVANAPEALSQDSGTVLAGYVRLVKRGGPETANCHLKDLAHRDWHIELVEHKDDPASKCVIVEVTPRLRPTGVSDYRAMRALIGQRVTVRGWLFFDAEHATIRTWRGTAYEIHPVTEIYPER